MKKNNSKKTNKQTKATKTTKNRKKFISKILSVVLLREKS